MATSTEFLDFVLEQLSGIGALRHRKMFGEAMIYLNDRPVILVCNDTVFVKQHDVIRDLMEGYQVRHVPQVFSESLSFPYSLPPKFSIHFHSPSLILAQNS